MSVPGEAMPKRDRPSRRYGKKRVCAGEGCETKLSIYNPGKYCANCKDPRDAKGLDVVPDP